MLPLWLKIKLQALWDVINDPRVKNLHKVPTIKLGYILIDLESLTYTRWSIDDLLKVKNRLIGSSYYIPVPSNKKEYFAIWHVPTFIGEKTKKPLSFDEGVDIMAPQLIELLKKESNKLNEFIPVAFNGIINVTKVIV